MNIVMERMRPEHLDAIAALETRCFSDPWSRSAIEPELENPLSLWLCAVDGDTLAGYVGSQSVLGEADMMNLAVAPEYRRRGIGRALVTELCDRLIREKQVHVLPLEVRDSNEAAIALYMSLGFCQVGLRKNYYLRPREDARILRKELI